MRSLEKPGICLSDNPTKEKFMPTDTQHEVVVTDVKVPFWSMVVFMIKLALASIPATIIISIIYLVAIAILGGLGGLFGTLLTGTY